jgi:hypothetical protein
VAVAADGTGSDGVKKERLLGRGVGGAVTREGGGVAVGGEVAAGALGEGASGDVAVGGGVAAGAGSGGL